MALFLAILQMPSSCLDPSKEISQYIHRVWTTENGLPQNYISAIAQTKDGYLWLGTQEGLVRFNGVSFKVFNEKNTREMKGESILTLLAGKDGSLWFGTYGRGLGRIKDGKFCSYTTSDGLSSNVIRTLFEDSDGALWVGTSGGGICRFKNERFTSFTTKNGLSSNIAKSIQRDQNGNLWIASAGGLNVLNNSKFTVYDSSKGLPDNDITVVYEDREKNIWIGTRKGLCRLSNGNFKIFTTKDGISDNSITSIIQDREGSLWIGTTNGGLNRFYNNKFCSFTADEGLSDKSINCIYEDNQGNLWIGTMSSGLAQFREGPFTSITTKEGLSNDLVWSVMQDHLGNVWIGTSYGVNVLTQNKIISYSPKNGLPNNHILSLEETKKGEIWIGTDGGGLFRFKKGHFKRFTKKEGLPNDEITALKEDEKGTLWIGTRSGLASLKNGVFQVYAGIMQKKPVYSIAVIGNKVWIGCGGGDIIVVEEDEIHQFQAGEKYNALSIYPDKTGNIWIGTYGGGLKLIRNDKISVISSANGLFSDSIFQILEDDFGNLWMSCNKGVFRVSKMELLNFAEGKVNVITSINYGVSEGMKTSECNGGSQPAGCKTKDGKLWFPTVKGVVIVDPKKMSISRNPVKVAIETVFAENEEIEPVSNFVLQPGRNKLGFRYASINYESPEKIKFRYKLDNFEKNWNEAGSRREAYYTNIPPGKYKFLVVASNPDGIWSETGASVEFYLKPYFYQTFYFRLFAVITVIVMTFLIFLVFYKVRVRILKAESEVLMERNRLAQEIHDTIAQGLQGIVILLQIAQRKISASSENLGDEIKKACWLARETLQETRHSVLSLHSTAEQRESFTDYLKSKIAPILLDTGMDFVFETTGTACPLSPIVEFNLMRITQEAVRNAVKHGSPNFVKVVVRYEERAIRLTVIDDGIGFNPNAQRVDEESGFGLIGMKERAKHIGAVLKIKSGAGTGTVVEISLKG